MEQRWNGSTRLYILGTLVALELLMSFSFLGYIHVEPISITTAYIPVLLAGALLGPVDSTLLGAVFGIASMWKASASYVMPFDQLFSPLLSGYPVKSLLLSVGARALFGAVIGLCYLPARRSRQPALWVGAVSFLGPVVHSALVYAALWAFFPHTGYAPLHALTALADPNKLLPDLVTAALVVAVWLLFHRRAIQQFFSRVQAVQELRMGEHYHTLSLVCIILVALGSSVAVAIYFVNRMELVLGQQGIDLTAAEYGDLLHLQIQFLIGILAMMALVIVFLIFNRRYNTYMDRQARTDPLTGALNRKAFFQACAKALRGVEPRVGAQCYFIMADIDRFKQVNDRYGHPEGDRVLQEAAQALGDAFGRDRLLGRIGGDEFALLYYIPLTRQELERRLRRFLDQAAQITLEDGSRISCSVGAYPIAAPQPVEALYEEADRLLYLAKEQGRARYVVGEAEASMAPGEAKTPAAP